MLAKRITKVTLTRTDDQTYPGWWLVEWTVSSTRIEHLKQSHYTEKAARTHVSNLLEQRADGLSIDATYSENA